MSKKNYEEMSKQVLELVGGKENITYFTHCVTRLRFNVRDKSRVDEAGLKKVRGIMGSQWSGEQLQVIVGSDVAVVYSEICKISGLKEEDQVEADDVKEKLTVKGVFNAILSYLSATVAGVIPAMLTGGLAMTVNVIFGPNMLNLYAADSNIYIFFNFLYEACFYFMPVLMGYSAAKKLNLNPIFGIYSALILFAPSLTNLVVAGTPFDIFGINMPLVSYAQSFLPIIVSVWFLNIVYKVINKFMPTIVSTTFTPFITFLIATPIILCFLAPSANILAVYIGQAVNWITATFGALGKAFLGAIWPFLVITGMHGPVANACFISFFEQGFDTSVFPVTWPMIAGISGMAVAAFFKYKKDEDKSLALSCAASQILGGVAEPTLFGIILKHKRMPIVLFVTGFVGSFIIGLFNLAYYMIPACANFLYLAGFVAGGTKSVIIAVVAALVSFVLGFALTYMFGIQKSEIEE